MRVFVLAAALAASSAAAECGLPAVLEVTGLEIERREAALSGPITVARPTIRNVTDQGIAAITAYIAVTDPLDRAVGRIAVPNYPGLDAGADVTVEFITPDDRLAVAQEALPPGSLAAAACVLDVLFASGERVTFQRTNRQRASPVPVAPAPVGAHVCQRLQFPTRERPLRRVVSRYLRPVRRPQAPATQRAGRA